MAGKTIDMSKLRKVIKLYVGGKSKVFISTYLGLSRNTVKKYIKQFNGLKVTFEELDRLSDLDLDELFNLPQENELSPKMHDLERFFPRVEKELKKTWKTLKILWEDYKIKYPDGFQRTQFTVYYNRWSKRINAKASMHMSHKAGDKMFVDYAGKTLEIIDRESGEVIEVEFFVAILGASQLTYAEASMSQKKEDFVESVENALLFFGGVPQAIVPDNLKSAVTKSHRYEPTINETFLDFAEHYGTTILPARSYRPKDKALVEGAVKILYTRIYSVLKDQQFFSLKSLNSAIKTLLEKHNTSNLTGKAYSRIELFEELERAELKELPVERFEIRKQAIVTVMNNGHILLSEDRHYYSVPYIYIRKKVKVLYTEKAVEIYAGYNRIAVHPRIKSPHNYSTIKDHLATTHQFMTEWNADRFISWAESIDSNVKLLIIEILNKKQHVEQSYKSCIGVLSLAKKVGNERLSKACEMALDYRIYNYKIVENILEKGLDNLIENNENQDETLPNHPNIRGNTYYK
jgi:transposase/predicted transcriptional regulator